MQRHVEAHLVVQVDEAATLALELTAADTTPAALDETLSVALDGGAVPYTELPATAGGRVLEVQVTPGRLVVDYAADVTGRAAPAPVTAADRLAYLRPSRYAESDRLEAVARAEFDGVHGARDLLDAVSSWVGSRLSYVPGSSGPTDGAVDTLLAHEGVCRDYAHLVIALLRARDVPARLVAVYAPGLDPMDFHAVVEAAVDDEWRVVDATLLAPRQSLLRIATGRDAADTAFLSNYGGAVTLLELSVSAWTQGELPRDDVTDLVSLG
ncbi:MAG: transglutaminase family protein [Jatrophihabitans endophyticus]|nr:transglutaminase family protein [Jatrophihabitans endophyticus]